LRDVAKSGGEVAAGRPGALARFLAPGFLLPFLIFWSCLDRTIILPLVPVIADDLGSTLVAAGMAVTAHALAYSILQLVWGPLRSEEHTSELQSRENLVCRLLLEKKNDDVME